MLLRRWPRPGAATPSSSISSPPLTGRAQDGTRTRRPQSTTHIPSLVSRSTRRGPRTASCRRVHTAWPGPLKTDGPWKRQFPSPLWGTKFGQGTSFTSPSSSWIATRAREVPGDSTCGCGHPPACPKRTRSVSIGRPFALPGSRSPRRRVLARRSRQNADWSAHEMPVR